MDDEMPAHEGAQRPADAIRRYRALLDALEEGFGLVELVREPGRVPELVVREANGAFARHTGLAEVAGRTVRELLPELEEDPRFKLPPAFMPALRLVPRPSL